jgi:PDZ domain-containing protein
MMMTLMVYNALTDQDLTYGKKIVGTGTINLDGTVGEIGGVKYKLMGAVKNDADLFIVPAGNYEEAMDVKKEKGYNIDIVSVETFSDVVEYLEGL